MRSAHWRNLCLTGRWNTWEITLYRSLLWLRNYSPSIIRTCLPSWWTILSPLQHCQRPTEQREEKQLVRTKSCRNVNLFHLSRLRTRLQNNNYWSKRPTRSSSSQRWKSAKILLRTWKSIWTRPTKNSSRRFNRSPRLSCRRSRRTSSDKPLRKLKALWKLSRTSMSPSPSRLSSPSHRGKNQRRRSTKRLCCLTRRWIGRKGDSTSVWLKSARRKNSTTIPNYSQKSKLNRSRWKQAKRWNNPSSSWRSSTRHKRRT